MQGLEVVLTGVIGVALALGAGVVKLWRMYLKVKQEQATVKRGLQDLDFDGQKRALEQRRSELSIIVDHWQRLASSAIERIEETEQKIEVAKEAHQQQIIELTQRLATMNERNRFLREERERLEEQRRQLQEDIERYKKDLQTCEENLRGGGK